MNIQLSILMKKFLMPKYKMPRRMRRVRRRRLARLVKRPMTYRGRVIGAGRLYRYRPQNKGGLMIVRKMPETIIVNSALGTAGITWGPTTPCVQLGTPVSYGVSAFYDVPFSISFRLNQLVNSTDITQLCDKYKIVGAYVRINHTAAQFTATAGGLASGTSANKPWIVSFTDHDDAVPPSVNFTQEHMGTKTKTFKNENSYIGLRCRPVPQEDVTGGFIVPARPRFINSANPGVEHFAIKGVIKNMWLPATADGSTQLRVDVALAVVGKDFQ